ncbi:MAG: hypothetical protein SNJ71_00265 [Bacteroidales bacterium]
MTEIKSITRKELADKCGVTYITVYRWLKEIEPELKDKSGYKKGRVITGEACQLIVRKYL